MNPYEVLGVDRHANEKTIKAAYRKLARKWHPDLFHTESEIKIAEIRMIEINDAFDILKTPEKRALYDAENPISVNIYEYYASKPKSKNNRRKTHHSADIENEKQRKAVVQFLDVEYERKNEIFDMFVELATGAVDESFSEEEYLEYLSLVLEEMRDCIARIQKIVYVAKLKQIKGLDIIFRQAQEVVETLTQKGNETPKSLKEARYVEETRILTEKIDELMKGFHDRISSVRSFALIDETWEFENDNQLNSVCDGHKREVAQLLKDLHWVQETASKRNINVGGIIFGNPRERLSYLRNEKTLDECIKMIEEDTRYLDLDLQGLRKEFWAKKCEYLKDSKGHIIFKGFYGLFDCQKYKGNFICPSNVSDITSDAFDMLRSVDSITIPAHAIHDHTKISVPRGSLKKLIFTFDTKTQTINVPVFSKYIIRKGEYICIYSGYSTRAFMLVNEKNVYIYDDEKLCELNGVTTMEQLKDLNKLWDNYWPWREYQLQIHA